MFVVFEGIDGSGKTTLSDRVAGILAQSSVTAFHARPSGELKSKLASRIRDMARDPRTLTMSPHTELLLYLARDCQMIDTVIRPALDNAQVVIADRYVYSPGILCRARGLVEESDIQKATELVARGLWPDLVIYCDVDIHTSDRRKKLDKIVNRRDPDDFGRKGLRGLGLRRAMRDDYLRMAKENPTWMTVDNVNHSITENSHLIANRILAHLGFSEIEMPGNLPLPVAMAPISADKPCADLFYDFLDRLVEEGYARMALYHARSLDDERAWKLRETHMLREPEITATGLEPLGDERAIAMRRALLKMAPRHVAISLKSIWAETSDDAWEMRNRLADVAPLEVAASMNRLDSDNAFALREKLWAEKDARGAVLSSLRGIDTPRAWEMRARADKKKNTWGLLESLSGIDTERAWEIRNQHMTNHLPWVIVSLEGIDTRAAWDIRYRLETQATKLVVRSLGTVLTDEAFDLRDRQGSWDKETLATIKGIDHLRAWKLREQLMAVWPGYVAKSVGLTLGQTPRGIAFMKQLAHQCPSDPDVAHYMVKLETVTKDLPNA